MVQFRSKRGWLISFASIEMDMVQKITMRKSGDILRMPKNGKLTNFMLRLTMMILGLLNLRILSRNLMEYVLRAT